MIAYCWATGLIEFGQSLPEGALPIARGRAKPLRDFVEQVARHGYATREVNGRKTKIPGTERLLVPGVPEATSDNAAVDALGAFKNWIREHAPKGVSV